MTDKEDWKNFLEKYSVCYNESTVGYAKDSLSIEGGYVGFFVEITFDKLGKFLEIGAYE